jgi:hypothetical protein
MRMGKVFVALAFVATALFCGGVQAAIQTLDITLTDVVTGGTATTGAVALTSSGVTFNGAVGNYTTNITVGTSLIPPAIGFDLSTQDAYTGAGTDTLKIVAVETGLSAADAQAALNSVLTGHFVSNFSASIIGIATLNASPSVTIGPLTGAPGSGSFSGSATGSATSVGPTYTLTEELDITTNAGGTTSADFSTDTAVPEPASLAIWGLLGAGWAGATMWRSRRGLGGGSKNSRAWSPEQRDAIQRVVLGQHNDV